jgi:glycosyltransferase involved in cell wall biosynthesis
VSPPLVSLCVPTWNRASSLTVSLATTLGQIYDPLEIIISDNGSTDETERIGRDLAARDSRVRYFRHERNIGLYANHNYCLDAARGDFICFFHDHDERDINLVRRYVAFMEAHPEAGVVSSDWYLLDQTGRQIGVRDYKAAELMTGLEYITQTMATGRSSIGVPGAMIRRSALGSIRFDEAGPIGFGDFVVWFQIAERFAIGHIRERLWSWRQDHRSQSARTIESLTHDFYVNLSGYCDAHLRRFPERRELVEQWRLGIHRYLFWALLFEVGLYFRHQGKVLASKDPTLFEILDYRLTPEQFRAALDQLDRHHRGPLQAAILRAVKVLIRLKLTQPLAWATQHYASVGALLGLR